MKLSHTSSNYFFRKSPSHYHMMLLVMTAYKLKEMYVQDIVNYGKDEDDQSDSADEQASSD